MRRTQLAILAAAAILAAGSPANAKLPFVKKAKDLGFAYIQNCASCHVDKMPKKEAKGEPFGEIGKWLLAQKAKNKAAEVDVAWLKDYKAK
jgi:mono/diheme cytochrome c family protein